jgi:hypothetical protein
MLTTLFLAAYALPPTPFLPSSVEAHYHPVQENPTAFYLSISARWTDPDGWSEEKARQTIYFKRDMKAPPHVVLLDFWLHPLWPSGQPLRKQNIGYHIQPYEPWRDGEITEVWFRDEYGRVVAKAPVTSPNGAAKRK